MELSEVTNRPDIFFGQFIRLAYQLTFSFDIFHSSHPKSHLLIYKFAVFQGSHSRLHKGLIFSQFTYRLHICATFFMVHIKQALIKNG